MSLPRGNNPWPHLLPRPTTPQVPHHWQHVPRINTRNDIGRLRGIAADSIREPDEYSRELYLSLLKCFDSAWIGIAAPETTAIHSASLDGAVNELCTICMMDLTSEDRVCFGCPAHLYHVCCFWEWIHTVDAYGLLCRCCPNCRQPMYEETEGEEGDDHDSIDWLVDEDEDEEVSDERSDGEEEDMEDEDQEMRDGDREDGDGDGAVSNESSSPSSHNSDAEANEEAEPSSRALIEAGRDNNYNDDYDGSPSDNSSFNNYSPTSTASSTCPICGGSVGSETSACQACGVVDTAAEARNWLVPTSSRTNSDGFAEPEADSDSELSSVCSIEETCAVCGWVRRHASTQKNNIDGSTEHDSDSDSDLSSVCSNEETCAVCGQFLLANDVRMLDI